MEPDHETGLSARSVAGATRSDGSATPDSPSASVAWSLPRAFTGNNPTLYTLQLYRHQSLQNKKTTQNKARTYVCSSIQV